MCGTNKLLNPVQYLFEKMPPPQKTEADFLPEPLDRSQFATVYKKQIFDDNGDPITDRNGDEV